MPAAGALGTKRLHFELLWTLSGPCDSFHQWIAVPRSLASLHFPPFNELTNQPLLETEAECCLIRGSNP
jgi:hypothetical protein